MWAELFLDNRDNLLRELDTLMENLDAYRRVLRDGDREALEALLREGRERKEQVDGQ
jgi:prephenate dehydrogenase